MAKTPELDRDKLRAAVRGLDREEMFYMLDEALDGLSRAKLLKLARAYFDLSELRPDGETSGDLLATVESFDDASRAGEYYEAFEVNSRNYTETSRGTRAWLDECSRLFNRCKAQEKKADADEVRESFDMLFELLDYVDECHDDVIFFADEGGTWMVGVDWEDILPSWFRVLSKTTEPAEYANRVTAQLKTRYGHLDKALLLKAREVATPAQREALKDV